MGEFNSGQLKTTHELGFWNLSLSIFYKINQKREMKQNNTQRYRNWSRRPFGWLKVAGALNHTCEQTDLSCDCLSSWKTKYAIIIIVIITFKLITSLLSKQFLTQKCNVPGIGSCFIWYYLFLAQFCNFSAPRLRRLEKQGIAAAQQSIATPDQLAVLWLELPGLYSEAHSTMPLHTPIQGMSKWSGTRPIWSCQSMSLLKN